MEIAMRMPDLGTVDDTIKVVKWLAEVGQPIRRGQPLVEVETDKSIMELESTVTGTLQAINVSAGGEAAAGQVIATFAVEGEQPPEAAARRGQKRRWPRPSSVAPAASTTSRRLAPRPAARVCRSSRRTARHARNRRQRRLPPITRASFSWICTGGWS